MSGLLSEDLLTAIGRVAEPKRELVTRRDIRKYAVATGSQTHSCPYFRSIALWPVV